MTLSYIFEEDGGYDCMTDAIIIQDEQQQTVATLDLRDFGQESCEPATTPMIRRAERIAQRLVKGFNAQ